MGIAILSGVVASLDPKATAKDKWETHTPGTMTPVSAPDPSTSVISDPSLPSRFVACVSQDSSALKLQEIFSRLGPLGRSIQVISKDNLRAVQQSDVVLLW